MIIVLAAGTSLPAQHAAHLLSVGIPVAMIVVGLAIDSARKSRARGRGKAALVQAPLFVAAGGCAAAALIHVWVMPQHFRESVLYGALFAGLAVAQLVSSWLVAVGRSRIVVAAVALGNAATICLWLSTRLIEIPLGPNAGATEAFGVLDVTASVFEFVVVAGCVAALRPGELPRRAVPAPTTIGEQVLAR